MPMFAKIKIRYKILILFTLFTLVLLLTIVVYFYINGIKYVKEQAVEKCNNYTVQFVNILEEEIRHSVIEIAGLRTQLSFIPTDGNDIPPPEFADAVEAFLHTYANKYSSITIFNKNLDSVARLSPVRLFTGDLVIQRDIRSINTLIMKNPATIAKDYTGKELVFSNISKSDTGIYIVSTFDEMTAWNLLFILRLDAIAEKGIQTINLDREATIAIYDSAGITVFCSDKKYIHQAVSQLIDENHSFIFNDDNTELMLSSSVLTKSWIDVIGAALLVKFDIASSVQQLNNLTFQAIIFILILFSSITMIVITISNKISKSISEIAHVADNVAAGNLDQTINVSRKDELGVLINSFNQMVENLKVSYRNLRITNKELEDKIEELTTTKAKLSEKERLAVIGETVSKISHEIQNKIGGVSIWIQNLEMQYADDETARIYIDEIKNTLNSFLHMLVNFKRFYRVPNLNKSLTDFGVLIENVIENFKTDSESKRVNFALDIDANIPEVFLDPQLIEEVILNMLINAVYFSPENGTIYVRCTQIEGGIEIEIADEGPGVNDQITGKIFQPFFTTKSSGSGLGLAIVKNIIKAHSGSITVSNREAGGACFRITLPVYSS